jgi:hypothetical protein
MKILLSAFLLSAMLILIASGTNAQLSATGSRADDLILLVEAGTHGLNATPLRIYQRIGEEVVAGVRRSELAALDRQGVKYRIIDENPWSTPYAVVGSPLSVMPIAEEEMVRDRSIARSGDIDVIKGTPEIFAALRARGFSCSEIERRELPPVPLRQYVPEAFPLAKSASIDSIISLVSTTSVTSIIQGLQDFGTRYWSNANHDAVASWVRLQFFNAGVKSIVIDSFSYGSTWQKNVIATIPGTVHPEIELVVGGHMDSYSSNTAQAPGADDNASGSAAAIEMARVLKAANYQPAYTLRFMTFGTEEAGLVGSASYASRARSANQDIRVMLNFDMIANRNQAQTDRDYYMVWYTGAEAFSNLQSAITREYTTLNPVLTTSYRSGSDSYSFWQQSYRSTFCIERDFSPYYHTPNDLIQYLDIPYAADIIRAGLATLLTLDAAPPSVVNPTIQEKIDGTSLLVQWDSIAVSDFGSYKIAWGTEPGVYTNSATQSGRGKLITGLTTGVRYYVGISIIDLVGREGLISELPGVPRILPDPPTGVSAYPEDHAVRLVWNSHPDVDVTGFNIYRSDSEDGPFTKLNTGLHSDTVWIDTLSTSGFRYYAVSAVDVAMNESAQSDTVTAAPIVNGMTVDVGLHDRWNIVSNPVITVYDSMMQLFESSAYPYGYRYADPAGYMQSWKLQHGVGYWTKSASAATAHVFGDALLSDSINVQSGWNLIGSISVPVGVASITSNPPGLVTSQFSGFDNVYISADTIQPGKGYWVNVTGDGVLFLADGAYSKAVEARIHVVPTAELPPPPPGETGSESGPISFGLDRAFPNPFNPETVIGFSLTIPGRVSLRIFDILGREVATLVDETKGPGRYSVTWDAAGMPGGVYFCRLQGEKMELTSKLMLMK